MKRGIMVGTLLREIGKGCGCAAPYIVWRAAIPSDIHEREDVSSSSKRVDLMKRTSQCSTDYRPIGPKRDEGIRIMSLLI